MPNQVYPSIRDGQGTRKQKKYGVPKSWYSTGTALYRALYRVRPTCSLVQLAIPATFLPETSYIHKRFWIAIHLKFVLFVQGISLCKQKHGKVWIDQQKRPIVITQEIIPLAEGRHKYLELLTNDIDLQLFTSLGQADGQKPQ